MRLDGKPVAEQIKAGVKEVCMAQRESGKVPAVAVIRIGEESQDIAYENRVLKNCAEVGLSSRQMAFPQTVTQEQIVKQIQRLNEEEDVLGILVLRPLPNHLDESVIGQSIDPKKDVDCMNSVNLSKLFMGEKKRVSPCTPEAVIEMLKYYQVLIEGKHVVIVNRSLVLGKPLALLFLEENATVTICHSKTTDLKRVMKSGDIVVTGVGKARFFDVSYFDENAVVVDVGINFFDGKICGDVNYEAVCDHVRSLSPVPGGVGAVTSAMLLRHCIQ